MLEAAAAAALWTSCVCLSQQRRDTHTPPCGRGMARAAHTPQSTVVMCCCLGGDVVDMMMVMCCCLGGDVVDMMMVMCCCLGGGGDDGGDVILLVYGLCLFP